DGPTTAGVLDVVDLSNPASPLRVARYVNGLRAYLGIAISGDFAYLPFGTSEPTPSGQVQTEGGLEVFDISNPTNPVFVRSFCTNIWASHPIAISGNYAFISLPQRALLALDISNPANPVPVGGGPFYLNNLAASGDYVYVANGGL